MQSPPREAVSQLPHPGFGAHQTAAPPSTHPLQPQPQRTATATLLAQLDVSAASNKARVLFSSTFDATTARAYSRSPPRLRRALTPPGESSRLASPEGHDNADDGYMQVEPRAGWVAGMLHHTATTGTTNGKVVAVRPPSPSTQVANAAADVLSAIEALEDSFGRAHAPEPRFAMPPERKRVLFGHVRTLTHLANGLATERVCVLVVCVCV